MPQPKPEELGRVPLFDSLSDEARSVLADLFEVRHFEPGAAILKRGHDGYSFFVIYRGHASVANDRKELRTLGPGDFFGEIAIMREGRRTATVTAEDPITVWELFGTSFRELEGDRPEVAEALQQAARDRLATG
jgi:CRP-like cAMP-binding protein